MTRRALIVAVLVIVECFAVAPARSAVPPEYCMLAYPAPTSCAYTTTQFTSFVGTGPFHIRVTYRDGSRRDAVRFDLTVPAGQQIEPLSGNITGAGNPYAIDIGDRVEGEVLGPGGVLAIGNPGAPPSSGPHTPPAARKLDGDVTPVHDPAIVYADGWYYLFTTGPGIPVRRSRTLRAWEPFGTVFPDAVPAWAPTAVPGTQDVWAPDVSFFGGEWHLYYAISTFGSKQSVIGHATSPTLDPPQWQDHGAVLASSADYNAIDPNVIIDIDGRPHLEFGSFYGGLKLVDLDPSGVPLAAQPVPLAANVLEYTAVEGGYMIQRGGWYYLFASYDYCCRGVGSTYNVRVGRSQSVSGPFVDDMGISMLDGGGRYVLTSNGRMRGPGGEGIIRTGNTDRIFFHWYDAANGGVPTLGILSLHWTADGWPEA